ncbi:ADM [Heterocephalus glaber]|uniref:Pro-adrenomedullin n=1 Tax=Heterocephalus glaber TaxID=10181 RepID=G5BFH3_HETGA|nr:ADM [Heterocephalus glaber]EHB08034.1 ADM [Heterocephalus glaber]
MKLVSVALVLLGAVAFLDADAAPLDRAPELLKKWNKWAVSREKRELPVTDSNPIGLADAEAGSTQTDLGPQDLKSGSGRPQPSGREASLTRVKRHRQSLRSFGCRFGTCTVQKLAHQIYKFTDKDKDGFAPQSKISPHGYGRRRRRSLPEAGQDRTLVSSERQALAARDTRVHQLFATLPRI